MIKHLLISLFCFTTFVAAQTNITGAWLTDWQNSPLVCSPFGFNITQTVINETTTNTTIDYFFSADTILHNCPLSTRNYSSPLVLNQSTNIWQDNTSQQIIYNQVADTVAYLLPATALQSQNLYDRTGSYLINGKVGSILGGHWINPTPVSANDNCPCVPYLVGAYPSGFSSFNVSAYLYYNSTTCSNGQASFDSGLYQPDPVNITWQFNSTNLTQPKFSLNTNSTPALLTLTINPGNNTCVYSYTKSQDGFVSGQWSLDWQTPNIENFPKLLSIGIFSQGFMKGIFTFKNNTAKNDFFVLNGPSQSSYATYNLEYNFYYDSTQNTFSASTQDNTIIYYTPNGSYFSQGAFTQNWTNPTTESNTQISPNDCCYPDTIVITGDPFNNSLLLANYTYSQDSLKSEWCTDISKYLNSSNVTETSLHIVAPSFTRLIWEDEIGYTLELLTPPSWSNITLNYQNDLGDQCLFNMQVASPNPPGPNPPNPNPPKGANLISSGLAFLLIILAAYL